VTPQRLQIQVDGLSAFRPCGRDVVEFFNSTGWAFYGQVAVLGSRNTEKDLHLPTCGD
jgi:hypothetical protein